MSFFLALTGQDSKLFDMQVSILLLQLAGALTFVTGVQAERMSRFLALRVCLTGHAYTSFMKY